MFGIGTQEIILVLVIALIVFGPKKLPEVGRSLGKALRELKRASNELMYTMQAPLEDTLEQPPHDSLTVEERKDCEV